MISTPETQRGRWQFRLRMALAYCDLWITGFVVFGCIIPCWMVRDWWKALKIQERMLDLALEQAEIARRKRPEGRQ